MPGQNTATRSNRPNLFQRKLTWCARYYIPKTLQPLVGRAEVVRSLGTRDKLEAHKRLPAVLAEIQQEIYRLAKTPSPVDYRNAYSVIRELEEHEEAIRQDRSINPDLVSMWVDNTVDQHFERFPTDERCPESGVPYDVVPEVMETAERVVKAAYDPNYRSITEWLEDHLVSMTLAGKVPSTRAKRERAVREVVSVFGPRRDPRTFGPEDVVRFGDHIRAQSASVRTKKDIATNVHTFFEWLRKNRRVLQTNPFHGLSEQIEGSRNDGSTEVRAWHPEELVTVFQGLNPKGRLWAIAAISLYSGMRINEVCTLEIAHVTRWGMQVTRANAKNANSARVVPIHPVIAPLIARLAETSYDGFLISGLTVAGQDKRRGAYPSKRFSELRKGLGLSDPSTRFHSFRHSFTTAAERCGVPVPTIEKLVGHARQGITLDRYSDGPDKRQLIDAVARISHDRPAFDDHPAIAVDELVGGLLQGHEGNAAWRRGYLRDLALASG